MRIRLVSHNAFWFQGVPFPSDEPGEPQPEVLEGLLTVYRALEPNLLCLQEVQPVECAQRLGMEVVTVLDVAGAVRRSGPRAPARRRVRLAFIGGSARPLLADSGGGRRGGSAHGRQSVDRSPECPVEATISSPTTLPPARPRPTSGQVQPEDVDRAVVGEQLADLAVEVVEVAGEAPRAGLGRRVLPQGMEAVDRIVGMVPVEQRV